MRELAFLTEKGNRTSGFPRHRESMMKRKDKSKNEAESAAKGATAEKAVLPQVRNEGWGLVLKWVAGILLGLQVAAMLALGVNQLAHEEIMSSSDAWHMMYFKQFGDGGHCYYPRSDYVHATDGYTPLASEIFGKVMRVFGVDIRPLRAVAFAFALFGCWLAWSLVRRATGSRFLGFAAAGLAAGLEMRWHLDVGPNTIHAVFSLLGVWLLARDERLGKWTLAGAGLALFASFWSKQLGIAYMVAGTVYVLLKDWRKGLALGGGMALLSLAGILYYSHLDGSQFCYWVFEMNRNQPIHWPRIWDVAVKQILAGKYAIVTALTLAGLALYGRRWKEWFKAETLLLGASAVAGVVGSCKYGSGTSQMWFFYLMLIVCGLSYAGRFLRDSRLAATVAWGLLAVQALAMLEDPRPHFLTREDTARYNQIMSILKTPDKSTYFINRNIYGILAKGEPWPNAGEDSWVNGVFDRNALSKERREYIESDPWDIVIIDVPLEDNSYALYDRLNAAYKPVREIPETKANSSVYDLRWRKIVFERKEPKPAPSATVP